MKKFFALFALLTVSLAPLPAAETVKVVSFSAILTEIARTVGGDAVTVIGLVKPGVDPHEYQPTPGDLKQLAGARLILASGKHLEHYLDKLQAASGSDAVLLKVGDQLPSLAFSGGEHSEDPHWWQSVTNVERATRIVRDALVAADPASAAKFQKNAAASLAQLAALNRWIKQQVALLPRDKRELVTSHDAFQYFARDYGFKIYAIEGIDPDQEASTRQVNDLIDVIRKEGVKAIFLEDTLNPKVSSQITRETGAKIGGTLYADGPGVDADTYEKMQRHNVTTIVEALK
ncbi:MAG TPA: zinc ABC transporter substrate-binding protein [Chthoniobacterales bacterium]